MTIVANVHCAEDFIIQVNGDYNICFSIVSVTVADALPAGTVLKDAATAAISTDTTVIGILAEDKVAGTQFCRVMVRGNPTLIDNTKLSLPTSSTIKTALEARNIIYIK